MPTMPAPRAPCVSRPPALTTINDHATEVVDYYRETADDYLTWSRDGYMHFGLWRRWINPCNRRAMLEAMNEFVFEALHLDSPEPAQVGDLGCGIGAVSHFGSQRFPQHRWHAFTICPRQVEIGARRFRSGQVSMRCADFRDLPLEDHALDAAFFLESLCHAEDIQSVLNESARVLKPGGRLVVVDGMMRHSPARTPRYVKRLASAVEKNWALGGFYPVPEFHAAAAAAGFSIGWQREMGWAVAPSVAHSPVLIAAHSLMLMLRGRWSRWKRRHMIGCALGIALGLLRRQFGYFSFSLQKTG